MATSSARPLEVEMEQPPSYHVNLSVQELEKRLDALPDQKEYQRLRAEGKSVTDLAEELLPLSYLEVQNLWSIEEDPILKLALENWKEKERYFDNRVCDHKSLIERTKYVVYQVVGIYFVFQGLNLHIAILKGACVAGPSKESRLYLIFLSLAASLLTILVITRKFKIIWDLERSLWSDDLELKEVVKRRLELARSGSKFVFRDNYRKKSPPRHSFFGHYLMDYGAMFVLYQTAWVFPLAVSDIKPKCSLEVKVYPGPDHRHYSIRGLKDREYPNIDKAWYGPDLLRIKRIVVDSIGGPDGALTYGEFLRKTGPQKLKGKVLTLGRWIKTKKETSESSES